jgi:endogenous inhibitor of DNA gyrase (YacG/DUF329 family)
MNSTCPICKKELSSEAGHSPFPFCSPRCKKIDLYRWFNEEYRFSEPVSPEELSAYEAGAAITARGADS